MYRPTILVCLLFAVVPIRAAVSPAVAVPADSAEGAKRLKAWEEMLAQYRATLAELGTGLDRSDKIVVTKIDNCTAVAPSAGIQNVWNKRWYRIDAPRIITNVSAIAEMASATKAMLTNIREICSPSWYHFPTHQFTFARGAETLLELSVSWEENTFFVSLPADAVGGRVCMHYDERLSDLARRVAPLSEFDEMRILRNEYRRDPAAAKVGLRLTEIDRRLLKQILRDFANTPQKAHFDKEFNTNGRRLLLSVEFDGYSVSADALRTVASEIWNEEQFAILADGQYPYPLERFPKLDISLRSWGPDVDGEVSFRYGYLAGWGFSLQYSYNCMEWQRKIFAVTAIY